MGNIYKKLKINLNKIINKITMFAFGEIFQDTIKHCILIFCINILFFFLFLLFFNLTNSLAFANIVSIGVAIFVEKMDKKYTTGFSRKDIFYSVVGLFISDIIIISIIELIK